MTQPNRLAADAAHGFGGIELDRARPLQFRLNGVRISGFSGDTVLTAALASGIDSFGAIDGFPLGLTDRFAPLVAPRREAGPALPMERLPARDGDDLVTVGPRVRPAPFRRTPHSLGHVLGDLPDAPWLRETRQTTLTADLVVIGAGVAGLAAADAAATAGRSVAIIEGRPWIGGDARYFGAVSDDETPEAFVDRLMARLAAHPQVTVLRNAEAFAVHGTSVLVHQIEPPESRERSRVVAVAGQRLLLATGARQRLPLMPGNRLPGVLPAVSAYHLAKRYGVSHGTSAIVATQANASYRLALRLHDCGVGIRRIVDTRLQPQSRFVDFSKASGLTLASGQYPLAVTSTPQRRLKAVFANTATTVPSLELEADGVIVAGPWQPDIMLWMQAGGAASWDGARNQLRATGVLQHVALAGAAAGWRTLRACAQSGVAAAALLFGRVADDIEDIEVDAAFETPDAAGTVSPLSDPSTFLDAGRSIAQRDPTPRGQRPSMSLGDVAASVETGRITAADAGTIAAERGAPGTDLVPSEWRVTPRDAEGDPPYLAGRFGGAARRTHLVVDARRRFEVGALVHVPGSSRGPFTAVGVIVEEMPAGGMALIAAEALAEHDRFVVETIAGPAPARIRPADDAGRAGGVETA